MLAQLANFLSMNKHEAVPLLRLRVVATVASVFCEGLLLLLLSSSSLLWRLSCVSVSCSCCLFSVEL